MKPDIITISLIMISCVFLPFFLLFILTYLENSRLSKKFRGEAAKYNLKIDQKEKWNQSILGIDPVQKKLLFVQKRNNIFSVELIDLLQVKDSKLIPVSVQSRKYRKQGSLLMRIDLQFTFSPDQGPKLLNLYDSRLNLYKEMELSHAAKWNDLIHQYLPIEPFLHKTAWTIIPN